MLNEVRILTGGAAFALAVAILPGQALAAVAAPTSPTLARGHLSAAPIRSPIASAAGTAPNAVRSASSSAGTITEFPIPDSNNMANGQFVDIAAGPDGNLWFTGSKIGRMTTTGSIGEFP